MQTYNWAALAEGGVQCATEHTKKTTAVCGMSIHMSIHMPAYKSAHMPINMHAHMFVCLYVHMSANMSLYHFLNSYDDELLVGLTGPLSLSRAETNSNAWDLAAPVASVMHDGDCNMADEFASVVPA